MEGKTIGLFDDHKPTASLILGVVETRLKQRFPTLTFSRFRIRHGVLEEDTAGEERAKLAAWASGVDAVVAAVGD
ncbi:MAG: hypothetical protein HY675_18865 [Chloroflexi bacterium]|nr:hypothetical protein [Chloroflexota bacterium]